jgi:uncharacterized protein (DUF983 family)
MEALFEVCPKCGNLFTTLEEIETSKCAACGAYLDDEETDDSDVCEFEDESE